MDTQVRIAGTDDLIEVHVTGKLTREAYQAFVPVIEEQIRTSGPVRVMFVMHDFHGWTAGALWDDLGFDLKHFKDIRKLALVGETRWQKGMAVFCKPFTTAKIRFFDASEHEKARAWLTAPAGAPA